MNNCLKSKANPFKGISMQQPKTVIENLILEKDPTSQELLCQYMRGSKKVSYEQVVRACEKERFARALDKACFGREFLIPLMIIPVFFYMLIQD